MDEVLGSVVPLGATGTGGSVSSEEKYEGMFQCPRCFQKYSVPETDVMVVRDHVRKHIGLEKVSVVFVRKMLKS